MQAERLQSYLLVWDERLIIKTFHFLDVLFVQLKKLMNFQFLNDIWNFLNLRFEINFTLRPFLWKWSLWKIDNIIFKIKFYFHIGSIHIETKNGSKLDIFTSKLSVLTSIWDCVPVTRGVKELQLIKFMREHPVHNSKWNECSKRMF